MRLVNLIICVSAVFAASCDRAPAAAQLVDGCYYVGGKPMFKITGPTGRVLIPGEVRTFTVQAGVDSVGAYATFNPGFFFEDADSRNVPLAVGTDSDRKPFRQTMKAGAKVPTVVMNWTTYGHEDAYLGQPC